MPIRHNNLKNTTTSPWKINDSYLDWYGIENGQSSTAEGTATDWTTNIWPASAGSKKTISNDGYGVTSLNIWGQHYWMLDVDMDCSKAVDGWFELKAFINNGQSWEADIAQANTPYTSTNHVAQCGKINKFEFNRSGIEIRNF
jgi:alpha-amylase